jgi:hypothetical protein
MFNGKGVKIIGLIATGIGIGATLLSNWVADKKMEETISEKISEILTKKSES